MTELKRIYLYPAEMEDFTKIKRALGLCQARMMYLLLQYWVIGDSVFLHLEEAIQKKVFAMMSNKRKMALKEKFERELSNTEINEEERVFLLRALKNLTSSLQSGNSG